MRDCNLLIKPVSGLCNLNCSYCFYADEQKNRTIASYGKMTAEVLEGLIQRAFLETEQYVSFTFQGGEPTLAGLDFYKLVVALQKKYLRQLGKDLTISNAIQTNGYTLDENWIQFFKENEFLVGISVDGTEFVHNKYRRNKEGTGSHQRVMESIKLLQEAGIEFQVLSVVTKLSAANAKDSYSFFKAAGIKNQQYIPYISSLNGEDAAALSAKDYSKFLNTLFDLWYEDLCKGSYVSIQQFENYVMLLRGRHANVCGMEGFCTRQYVIEANGDVFPCDFYVLDGYQIGNIIDDDFAIIEGNRSKLRFVEESMEQSYKCSECTYFQLCRNGCKRNRNKEKNIFCEAYKDFFAYALDRLQKAAHILQ